MDKRYKRNIGLYTDIFVNIIRTEKLYAYYSYIFALSKMEEFDINREMERIYDKYSEIYPKFVVFDYIMDPFTQQQNVSRRKKSSSKRQSLKEILDSINDTIIRITEYTNKVLLNLEFKIDISQKNRLNGEWINKLEELENKFATAITI